MRVLLVHMVQTGSVPYRITEPADAVRAADTGVEVLVQYGIRTTMRPPSPGAEPEVVDVETKDADVIVLQVPKTAEMLQVIRILKQKGVAVVVEIDDLLSGVPYGHMAHTALIKRGIGRQTLECTREADYVTTSTPALVEEYAKHGRGAVVANAIPRPIAELPPAYERDPQVLTIGWTGNVIGHPYDLQEMGSGLRQALDRTQGRSRFLVIGQKWDARKRLGLSAEPDEIPWFVDIDEYRLRVGQMFDIGIAPLRLDRFNECKSWLKPLEYSARGVFCVRARTGEYERLGLGAPAKAPKDWTKHLSTAVQDADRRRELAAAARDKVLAGHLTEHRVEEWVGAWRAALEYRARTRPAVIAVGS